MAENVVLLFKPNHIEFGKDVLDKYTFQKPPADIVDGPIYGFGLNFLNKAVSKYIPDEFKPEFHEAMDLVVDGDYDDAGAEAIDMVKQLVEKWEKLGPGAKEIVLGLLEIIKGALAGLD